MTPSPEITTLLSELHDGHPDAAVAVDAARACRAAPDRRRSIPP